MPHVQLRAEVLQDMFCKFCVLQTKHTSSSPSTRKNRRQYHKFQSIVYSSLHPIEKIKTTKPKQSQTTQPLSQHPKQPEKRRINTTQEKLFGHLGVKREHMDLYLRHVYLQHLSTFQVMSSPA